MERHGDRIAVRCDDGRSLTYAEFAARSDAVARAFGPARTLVLIEAANEVEPLLAYVGAMRAGHVVLLVSGETEADRLRNLIECYRPAAGYRKEGGEWRAWQPAKTAPALHPDLSLLLSTSGSTGSAKLVRLSRQAVEANAASIADYLGIRADDRAATTLPFHYSYGLSIVHSHLRQGAMLLLTDRSVIDPAFRSFVTREGVTSLAGVPYTYELFERAGLRADAPSSLRTMTQAGGRLPAETARLYADWAATEGVRFFVMYGQTEATARMSYMPPERLADFPGYIGVAVPGGRFQLVDDHGVEIDEPGRSGELIYSGPNVMMGYAVTAEDLSRPAEHERLATGDLAERNDLGLYRIVGRRSRFIKPFETVEKGLREIGVADGW